jgi:hypothetical protein
VFTGLQEEELIERGLTVVRSPDLASRRNLSHKWRSGRYEKRTQETWVIDGPLLRHPCVIRLGRLRVGFVAAPSAVRFCADASCRLWLRILHLRKPVPRF